jgi:hypothetical protein
MSRRNPGCDGRLNSVEVRVLETYAMTLCKRFCESHVRTRFASSEAFLACPNDIVLQISKPSAPFITMLEERYSYCLGSVDCLEQKRKRLLTRKSL